MKVILLKDAKKIGRKYEIKDVAEGYATNMLIPQGYAVPATASYVKLVEAKKQQDALMREEFKKAFEYGIGKLPGGKLKISGKANDKGHLFAAISKADIIENFRKETGVMLSDEHFELEKPIKEAGEHVIEVKIGDAPYKLAVLVETGK
ncbi:MAG: 50S ribosomal protein L9 [Patescibacteria group bacterium]|nr:50S ribosomal protein L9 [Patescibacteria group bacterium]MDE1945937.1 50S ribosomal protein L9 [Patescibacteria group bacterium]